MKRAALLAITFAEAVFLPAAVAQEAENAPETPVERAGEAPAEGEHGKLEAWKWANFVLLAGGLGYLVRKNAGPFFAARSQQIRREKMEAQEARPGSDLRAADVDRRLASLETAIAALRSESEAERKAEAERIVRHTAAEIAKVQS